MKTKSEPDEVFQNGQTRRIRNYPSFVPFSIKTMIIFALILTEAFGQKSASAQSINADAAHSEATAKFEAVTSPCLKLSEPVRVHWKISNNGSKPMYVYASILNSNRRIDTQINQAKKTLTLDFTFTLPSPIAPYAYLPLNFITIVPGQVAEGIFETQPAEEFVGQTRPRGSQALRLFPGQWSVNAVFGYGYETDSVSAMFSKAVKEGVENPINALVRWQLIAQSAPLLANFAKARENSGTKLEGQVGRFLFF